MKVTPLAIPDVLLIERLHDGDEQASEMLELDFDARTKSRLRTRLASLADDGAAVAVVLTDGTLITGQNPASSEAGAHALLKLLG